MAEELRNIKDDASNDYLLSRQVAHEFNSPGTTAFINSFSRQMQEPPKGQMAEQRFRETQKGQPKEETEAELTKQTEDPYLDPVSAAAGGFGGAGVMSLKQGMKLMPALGRAITAGVVGGIADYPIGAATEVIEEKHPALALPFNVITGLVSGATLESAIEKGVIKALGKAADSDTIRRVVSDMKLRLSDETGTLTFKDLPVNKKLSKLSIEQLKENPDVYWHGSPSGELKGSETGLHVGTYQAAKEALEARIGIPANGEWDGTKEYGKTLIAGRKTLEKLDPKGYNKTGFNASPPDEDYYPTGAAKYSDRTTVSLKSKPNIVPVNIKGEMSDVTHEDFKASGYMKRQLKKGTAKKGYFYKNVSEDEGSTSAVLPSAEHLEIIRPEQEKIIKSVINSLNDTINNEIGAVGDIKEIRKRLEDATDVKAELSKIQAEQAKDTAKKVLVSIGRQPDTSAKAEAGMLHVANIEDLALKDKAININLARIESEDDIKKVLTRVSEIYQTEIQTARRGVRPNEMTKRTANLLGMTPEDLLQRRRGQAFNAEEALAARRVLVSSAENIHGLAQKVKTLDATDEDKFAFRRALNVHYAIQAQVSGMTAEAGRALQQFNIKATSSEGRTQAIKEFLGHLPGDVTIEKMADAISTIDSVEGVTKAIPQMLRATTKDMFLEAWINGLLSGPHTHAINSLSNSLNAVWQVPERYLAALWGRVLPGEQVIKETEALHQAYGLVEGFKDGIKAFAQVAKTGMGTDEFTKLEASRYRAITAENVRRLPAIKKLAPNALQEGGVAAKAVDFMGETIRLPGRFLMAEDELFKSVGYRMELRAQAFRMASQEGLTGQARAGRMAEILRDPEGLAPNVHLAAIDASRYATFTNPLESKLLGALSQSKNPVIKLIVPFVRTPTNILKYAFDRTPFAMASSRIRADINAGGARRDLALARISMGSMLMGTAAVMAAEGRITGGGPSDPKLQANLRRQGWQPYSIKIGDKYVQYGRLEPLGMLFGLAGDFAEITGLAGEELTPEAENLASAIVMSISKNVTSKTWLRGISEAVQAMDDPDRYGNRYIQNYARSLVPSIIAQAERTIDPEMEAVYGMVDSIKSRIPGYSSDLKPRRDLWGDPISTQWGTGKRTWAEIAYQTVSPIYISEGKPSAIDKELTRMKIGLSKPQRKQSIAGVPMELTHELYDEFIQLSTKNVLNGKDLKEFLNEFVKSPDYKQMSDERKGEEIRDIMTRARNIAKNKMIGKYPQLIDIATSWKQRLAQ